MGEPLAMRDAPNARDLDRAKKLALRWTGDQDEADDLVGDALLRFAKTYDSGRSAPYTHLVWTMRSVRTARARTRQRLRQGEGVALDDLRGEAVAPGLSPETIAWLAKGIATLPARFRIPVAMYLRGSSVTEISDELFIRWSTAERYVFQGRALLRELLEFRSLP